MQVLILAGRSRETGVEFLEFLGDRKVTVNQLVEALKAAGLPEFCKILPQGTGNKDTCNRHCSDVTVSNRFIYVPHEWCDLTYWAQLFKALLA